MNRRDFIATVGAVGTVAVAGCSDLLSGEGIESIAAPASITEDALARNGFQENSVDELVIEEEVTVNDTTREVVVRSWVSGFTRSGDETPDDFDADITAVTLFATPSETIAGRELNPAAQFTNERVVEEASGEFGDADVEDLEEDRVLTVEILGSDVEITVFAATAVVDGEEHDVTVYVGEASNEGDLVMPVGVHPDRIDDEDTIVDLFEGIEHPVDPPETGGEPVVVDNTDDDTNETG